MVAVASLEWQDVMDGKFSEQSTRQAWREAVTTVAAKAKAALPEANGRIDAAVKMVLAGDVELQSDGTAKVASQSNGQTVYHVVNGECSCKDYPKAPQSMCKHRIAYGIHKRAKTLVTQRLEQLDGKGQQTEEAPQVATPATPQQAPGATNGRAAEAKGRVPRDSEHDGPARSACERQCACHAGGPEGAGDLTGCGRNTVAGTARNVNELPRSKLRGITPPNRNTLEQC